MKIDGLINLIKFARFLKENSNKKKKDILKHLGLNNDCYYLIQNYKKKLECFGYKFVSKGGAQGGITIIDKNQLTKEEISIIEALFLVDNNIDETKKTILDKIKVLNKRIL